MPKMHRDYPDKIFFMCSTELRQKLVALAYLRGSGGSYAAPARDLLDAKIFEVVSGLEPRQKADYDEILKTVQARDAVKMNRKPESE